MLGTPQNVKTCFYFNILRWSISSRSLASSHRHPSIITMATRVSFHFLFSISTWRTSLMGMLSSIGSFIRLTKRLCVLACTCPAATIQVHQCIAPSQPSPPFHPREHHPSIPHIIGSFFHWRLHILLRLLNRSLRPG